MDPILLNMLNELIHSRSKMFKTAQRREAEFFLFELRGELDNSVHRKEIAEALMTATSLCKVIPAIYSEYIQIVHDGVSFLLEKLRFERLIPLIVDQILLGEEIPTEKRLIELAKKIPTLHKLGQIIARNQSVDLSFRKWLVYLENDLTGTDIGVVLKKINEEISTKKEKFFLKIGNKILSEASVGVVIPFQFKQKDTLQLSEGVFKLLKPHVKEQLQEELKILDELARYFDSERQKYTLKDFRFLGTFQDIKEAFLSEINLKGEQENLKRAALSYGGENILIPRLLSFSTNNMTAMEQIKGEKITEVSLTERERKILAKRLFFAVIGVPLFSRQETVLFHGDPHAGNIFVVKGKGDETEIALLDWSMAGNLTRMQRLNILKLCIYILMDDEERTYERVKALSGEDPKENSLLSERIKGLIHHRFAAEDYHRHQLLKRTFLLIDDLAKKGMKFHKDLLLFRKAIFTLEGVLHDLDPTFNMDECIYEHLWNLMIEEAPLRWFSLCFPLSEHSLRYKSLLSNWELVNIMNHYFENMLRKNLFL